MQLDKADAPLKWTIAKAGITDHYVGGSAAFVANDGTVFVSGYRGSYQTTEDVMRNPHR